MLKPCLFYSVVATTTEYFELADEILQIRVYDHPMLEFNEMLVAAQLLTMEIAIRFGNEVDMPRNLTKSVAVECSIVLNARKYPQIVQCHPRQNIRRSALLSNVRLCHPGFPTGVGCLWEYKLTDLPPE